MLELLDWRRQVSELYAEVRAGGGDAATWQHWRDRRDGLFRNHSQTALTPAQSADFPGLTYFDYDPAFRVAARVDYNVEQTVIAGEVGEGPISLKKFGRVAFDLPTGSGTLSLFWIMAYGGGLFLPFGDATNRETTYGAGRYLYDTVKGADLGAQGDELVLDFNYAYHPSCVYNAQWVCPLAPPENKLAFMIPAGEKLPAFV